MSMTGEACARTGEADLSIGKVKLLFCKTRLICQDEREINRIIGNILLKQKAAHACNNTKDNQQAYGQQDDMHDLQDEKCFFAIGCGPLVKLLV